jgi:hypothetical protein
MLPQILGKRRLRLATDVTVDFEASSVLFVQSTRAVLADESVPTITIRQSQPQTLKYGPKSRSGAAAGPNLALPVQFRIRISSSIPGVSVQEFRIKTKQLSAGAEL